MMLCGDVGIARAADDDDIVDAATLSPQSPFSRSQEAGDDRRMGEKYLDIAQLLKLALKKVYPALRQGAQISEVIARFRQEPGWNSGFDDMVYFDETLLIPLGEKYIKVSGAGWEEIDRVAGKDMIYKHTAKNRQDAIVKPFQTLDRAAVRKIIYKTRADVDLGDYVIQSLLVSGLLRTFPNAQIFVVNRIPEIWQGIERVSAVARESALAVSPIDAYDLVLDFDPGSSDWLHDGMKNKVICEDRTRDALQYVDNAQKKIFMLKGVPVYRYYDAGYNHYAYYRGMADALGVEGAEELMPAVRIGDSDVSRVRALMREGGIGFLDDAGARIVLVNPFSAEELKELSVEQIVNTVRLLQDSTGPETKILIDRGVMHRHRARARDIEEVMKLSAQIDPRRVKVVAEAMRLRDLITLISLSDAVVGVDTATAHIAQAFGVDTITLFIRGREPMKNLANRYEWASLSPRAITVDLYAPGGTGDDYQEWIANMPIGKIATALMISAAVKSGAWAGMFSGDAVPVGELLSLDEQFEDMIAALGRGEYAQAGKLWRGWTTPAIHAFVSRLKDPFAAYYRSEIFDIYKFVIDGKVRWGLSGYIRASNLYKLVGLLKTQIALRGGLELPAKSIDADLLGVAQVMGSS